MMDAKNISDLVEAVQHLLTQKFGIKRAPLGQMLKRAGRRLPRRIRGKMRVIIYAQQMAGNPRMARQVDHAKVTQAVEDVRAYLQTIDVTEQRKRKVLGLAGIVVFNLLLVIAAFIIWLWWRGFI